MFGGAYPSDGSLKVGVLDVGSKPFTSQGGVGSSFLIVTARGGFSGKRVSHPLLLLFDFFFF